MTAKAYVLIETQTGKAEGVVEAIRKLRWAVSAEVVTGPYDIIAVIVGETWNDIGDVVVSRVHPMVGVSRTVTCLASLSESKQS